MSINLVGACDLSLAALHFAELNWKPRVMVKDMLERRITENSVIVKAGHFATRLREVIGILMFVLLILPLLLLISLPTQDIRDGREVEIPRNLELYSLGFPCTPFSSWGPFRGLVAGVGR